MNVFEDLIEELKEENLLETTVIESNQTESYYEIKQPQTSQNPQKLTDKSQFSTENSSSQTPVQNNSLVSDTIRQTEELSVIMPPTDFEKEAFEIPTESLALKKEYFEAPAFETGQLVENLTKETPTTFSEEVLRVEAELQSLDKVVDGQTAAANGTGEKSSPLELLEEEIPQFPEYELLSKNVVEDSQFYRRRANEEVTSLQIVEHIITAIEKEQMKIVPQSYDDLAVSMALHDFLQADNNPLSDEHTQAEFKLMQETEKWYSALALRDKSITVGDLRRYTENARPALSSQALISLARFYRNSPFSEAVRSKFDMVVTKLVSKENWDDTRTLLFNREELISQLNGLYADWSSIPLYETDEDDSDVLIGVLKFEDFISEVNNADSLDELIKSDFFNRIRIFKETSGEKFFAPMLAASATECNIIVGNKYVQLVQQERSSRNESEIEEKYNFLLDQPVSDTVSKTLKLVELLKEKKEPVKLETVEKSKVVKEELVLEKSSRAKVAEIEKKRKEPRFKFNKWLAAVLVLAFLGLGGLYTWAEFLTPQMKPSPNVKKVSLENSSLKEYFKTARINRETFFAVTETSWDKLSKEVKEDVLKKTLAEGRDKGYNKIHVLDGEGKTVAFASEKGVTLDPK